MRVRQVIFSRPRTVVLDRAEMNSSLDSNTLDRYGYFGFARAGGSVLVSNLVSKELSKYQKIEIDAYLSTSLKIVARNPWLRLRQLLFTLMLITAMLSS